MNFRDLRKSLLGVLVIVAGAQAEAWAQDKSPADADLVERGRYLSLAGDCMPCHTGAPKEEFAGGLGINTPFGTIYSPNITPDDETGIGKWTFADFKNAVHDGIRADGAYLYPAMPYDAFTRIEESDLKALWAYLRSLKAIHKPRKANGLWFPFNIREMMFFWRTLFFDEAYFKPDQKKSATWNRGAYLVEALAHCNDCHTPRNLMGATIPSERFEGAQIDDWYAPNITAKALKEINKWDVAGLADFLKKGAAPNSTTLGPMNIVVHDSLSKLEDSDLTAIATYMLDDDTGGNAPVEPDKVAKLAPKAEADAEKLYTAHCAPCHQKTGEGMPGKVPPLANNPAVEATDPYNILAAVLGGLPARDGYLAMPSFANQLSNEDIADVANYVRTTWGNNARPDTTPAMVASWRSQVESAETAQPGKPAQAAAKTAPDSAAAPAPSAAAAVPSAAAPATDPLPKSKPFYIVTSDLIGLSVRNRNDYAETLGTLSALVIDSTSGKTLYAIIDRGGLLGLGEYKVVVPFQLIQFTGQYDNPMLAMSAFKLENAPRITDAAAEQSADWRRSVDDYFGIALSAETSESGQAAKPQVSEASPQKEPAKSPADAAVAKGKQIAATQCSACHHFDKGGGTLVGPDLYGVYDSKIAGVADYSFSPALKKHTGTWDEANLNEWLKSPSTFAPGTYMTFPGLPSQTDRDDVIAYLKSLKP